MRRNRLLWELFRLVLKNYKSYAFPPFWRHLFGTKNIYDLFGCHCKLSISGSHNAMMNINTVQQFATSIIKLNSGILIDLNSDGSIRVIHAIQSIAFYSGTKIKRWNCRLLQRNLASTLQCHTVASALISFWHKRHEVVSTVTWG